MNRRSFITDMLKSGTMIAVGVSRIGVQHWPEAETVDGSYLLASPLKLSDLQDVTVDLPREGDWLTWNGSEWTDRKVSDGGFSDDSIGWIGSEWKDVTHDTTYSPK